MRTKIGIRLILLLAVGATIGCDRVTKHVAATRLSEGPSRSFLADTFRLEYAENSGGFLSLGADWPRPVRAAVFGAGNALLLALLHDDEDCPEFVAADTLCFVHTVSSRGM